MKESKMRRFWQRFWPLARFGSIVRRPRALQVEDLECRQVLSSLASALPNATYHGGPLLQRRSLVSRCRKLAPFRFPKVATSQYRGLADDPSSNWELLGSDDKTDRQYLRL
jgi:hypothetical protein